MTYDEAPLEPQRPIIDPHLHLWDIRSVPGSPQAPQTFLLPDVLQTLGRCGHNITHTVFVECHAMYRQDGPPELRSLGEIEFANGVAAMSASGGYGMCRIAHRIVGAVDLRLGAAVLPILETQVARAGDRFCGVRCNTAYDEAGLFGAPCDLDARDALRDPRFLEGAIALQSMGLSLDVWCLHSQLDDLIALASATPELTIVLDHVGTPGPIAADPVSDAEMRTSWRLKIQELAQRPNVLVKLGGLGMDLSGPISAETGRGASERLAAAWRPYLQTCIEAFGPSRCMFESNFPPDRAAGSYGAVWNAFKIIAADASEDEKDWLFRRTAASAYRIALV